MKLNSAAILTGSTRLRRGFSMVEVQVVVAIVALVAAIIVPQLPRFLGQAESAKVRSNAKNLAAVASAASAAGIEFVSLDMAVAEMLRPGGVTSSTGQRYGMTLLSAEEAEAAKQYLGFWDGQVVYQSN